MILQWKIFHLPANPGRMAVMKHRLVFNRFGKLLNSWNLTWWELSCFIALVIEHCKMAPKHCLQFFFFLKVHTLHFYESGNFSRYTTKPFEATTQIRETVKESRGHSRGHFSGAQWIISVLSWFNSRKLSAVQCLTVSRHFNYGVQTFHLGETRSQLNIICIAVIRDVL